MESTSQEKNRELESEQRLAAHTLDRHIAVTAGPGAGKTTVLVERYLHILRTQEISVDQIVAITFTNRAANEMRERLRTELDKLLWSAESHERAKWMRHKRTLEGAIITTIHGFCARFLREFPVEADIDPQFTLLDAQQSAMLEEAVVEETVTEFISANHQSITELAAGVGRPRLARGLIDIYRSIRNQGLTVERLSALVDKHHGALEDYGRALNALDGKMQEFIQTRGASLSIEDKRREAAARWPAFREVLLNAPESLPIAEFAKAVRTFRDETKPSAQGKLRELIKQLEELIWKDKLGGVVPRTFLDLFAGGYATAVIEVVRAIEHRLDEEKRRRSALDFDDLQVRALKLLEEHREVSQRTASRYRFFLVDEFQDTNSLQRDLMVKLALGNTDFSLSSGTDSSLSNSSDFGLSREKAKPKEHRLRPVSSANLFIVGDRKQSIYGFRGADVDVFREMTARIESQGGLPVTLSRNFRSQPPLIAYFNFLFQHVFEIDHEPPGGASERAVSELGFVEHEASKAAREDADNLPLVELLIDVRKDDKQNDELQQSPDSQRLIDELSDKKPRERDAEQLARRIASLVSRESISTRSGKRPVEYRDIALLFRAMTEAHIYEGAFRRAGIPYVTVDGKGFYAREEISDFVELLRFLDNKTDEVALAAVLRSPFCGLSDDTLFALRCTTRQTSSELPLTTSSEPAEVERGARVRPLLDALRSHELIDSIDQSERPALDRARALLDELIRTAMRSRVSELLRFAVEASEYRTVAAANFDGAQRLANIEKLFTLAERFENSGAYMIRDFVRFVHDFEEAGGRESEGQIDDSADAVRLMSIHQSKGLEFPVVIIPDLHRQPDNRREWWALDRHRGLTVKVPDGAGTLAQCCAYAAFTKRAKLREEFESMRLLYVATTRAQDRVILSGAVRELPGFKSSWLGWICKALDIGKDSASGLLTPAEGVAVQVTLNLLDQARDKSGQFDGSHDDVDLLPSIDEKFPLLDPIEPHRTSALYRFSVTQLLNYQRCPRQYYFDRVLHTPDEEQVAVWNDAEAPEPPANLTATLRGAVIHRFCEVFAEGDDLDARLKASFDYVILQRAAQLGERVSEIHVERALKDLLPLAKNYLESNVRQRIEAARILLQDSSPITLIGALSEQRFRIRRPLGFLTGTIDKLLVVPVESGGVDVEIIDFKTNRFRVAASRTDATAVTGVTQEGEAQLSFGFLETASNNSGNLMQGEIDAAAEDYQIQMQAYALAVRELVPEVRSIRATLHFLHPNAEITIQDRLIERETCVSAIDRTLMQIVSSSSPESFPPQPGERCRRCNFLELCDSGRHWIASASM